MKSACHFLDSAQVFEMENLSVKYSRDLFSLFVRIRHNHFPKLKKRPQRHKEQKDFLISLCSLCLCGLLFFMQSLPSTLVELLRSRALQEPERLSFTFLADGEREEGHLSYAELDHQARAIGALLQRCNAEGERALLLYPPSLEFIT